MKEILYIVALIVLILLARKVMSKVKDKEEEEKDADSEEVDPDEETNIKEEE